jgi:hypothetical protein
VRAFPDPYNETLADVRKIFDRVCGYMKLPANRFDVEVVPGDSIPGAAGVYRGGDRPKVLLASSQLSDLERLVATIAHELAHDILLGGGLITEREEDHEPLTDLVPVFLGLGLFTANAPVRERSHSDNSLHYFRINKQGYLPSRMIGYAMALFAYARGELKPTWARYLRPDAAQPFKGGLRYLLATGDSLFPPSSADHAYRPPTMAEITARLATGSPTVRLMTLSDIANLDTPPLAVMGAVVRCLGDPDADVQIEAARVLPRFGAAAQVAAPDLLRCLASRSSALRTCAAAALPVVGAPATEVVPELSRLLEDPDPAVVDAAAGGLHQLAPSAAAAVPALVEAIRMREIRCDSSEILASALIAIDPPAEVLQSLLNPFDHETRRLVLRSLRTARFECEGDGPTSSAAAPSCGRQFALGVVCAGPTKITRRTLLATALGCGAGIVVRARGAEYPGGGQEPPREQDDATDKQAVEALGAKAKLRPFRSSRSTSYLAIGDAPADFQTLTLRDCELVAADYLDHYRAKGFGVTRPARRLTVVTLADDRSFAAFLDDPSLVMKPSRLVTMAIHGVYQPETNRLIVFDHRALGPDLGARAGYENLRVLAHEATHQLTFNTGLLRRGGDVPTSILEGLARYGEVRKPAGRTPPGQINHMCLQDLAQTRRVPWISVAALLEDDGFLKGAAGAPARILGYAEAWLLVHYLMNDPSRTIGFRHYLEAIRERTSTDKDHRLADARQHLGDLDRLNDDLRQYAVRLQKTV